MLGTIIQIGAGLAGVDLPADLRDVTYDIHKFELSLKHLFQSGLDLLALAPVIGVVKNLKYGDEVAGAFKNAAKRVDRLEEARNAISKGEMLSKEAKKALRSQACRLLEATGEELANKEVHHILPLEWAHLLGKNFNPNELNNLVALGEKEHDIIDNMWRAFRSEHKNKMPTAIEISNFAEKTRRVILNLTKG